MAIMPRLNMTQEEKDMIGVLDAAAGGIGGMPTALSILNEAVSNKNEEFTDNSHPTEKEVLLFKEKLKEKYLKIDGGQ